MKKLFLTILIVLSCVGMAHSADMSVTLQWQANTEPDLAGYRAFYRLADQGYNYAIPAWEGTVTTCQITGLDDTKTYYFVLRAFDAEGYESGNSNEVYIINGAVPDGLPPGRPTVISVTKTVTIP